MAEPGHIRHSRPILWRISNLPKCTASLHPSLLVSPTNHWSSSPSLNVLASGSTAALSNPPQCDGGGSGPSALDFLSSHQLVSSQPCPAAPQGLSLNPVPGSSRPHCSTIPTPSCLFSSPTASPLFTPSAFTFWSHLNMYFVCPVTSLPPSWCPNAPPEPEQFPD